MVRARVVRHRRDWEVSGYNEIQKPWQRKSIIDFELLMSLLNTDSHRELTILQNEFLDEEVANTKRNPIWTESVAVGDDNYLQELKDTMGARGIHKQIANEMGSQVLREESCCYLTHSDLK